MSYNNLKFEYLTPKDDIKDIKIYLVALKNSLENPYVKNIAVTGPYGSGKSSILKTFFKTYSPDKKNEEKEHLFVSLAEFEENDEVNNNIKENLIENGILKQLTYRLENKKTPNSRFRSIEITESSIKTIIIIIFLASLILSITPIKYFIEYITTSNNNSYILGITATLSPIALLMSSFLIINYFLKHKLLKKIKLKDAELEFDKSNDFIFDKYLDEILYFFEVSNYKVVIFEDLDRFNNINIFKKLREINSILNNNDRIKRKKDKITFIYAIRDNLFDKHTNRTKFFDFIIPIIPILDSYNSRDWLIKKLEENNIKLDINISKKFVNGISLFITEMRILINIFNEFIIYREKLILTYEKEPSLKEIEQLFALITYKNIEPNDFVKLHNNEGILYDRIKNKTTQFEKWQTSIDFNNKSPKLIDFLINNNYIDRYFHNFISTFVEGNFTKNDINFIRNVISGYSPNYYYNLNNIKSIIDFLDEEEFKKTSILNYNLLNTLIENEKKNG